MESEYEYDTDEDRESNDESESEFDEINVDNLPTFSDRINVSEYARTVNVPSVLRPPSGDVMASVVSTHEPPSLPLEMGQSVDQNINMVMYINI